MEPNLISNKHVLWLEALEIQRTSLKAGLEVPSKTEKEGSNRNQEHDNMGWNNITFVRGEIWAMK
jgi:hypothetical protein